MQIVIRKWNYADTEAIARLNQQWGYPSTTTEIKARLLTLSNLLNNELFIAEADHQVVGFLHIYRHFTLGNNAFAEIGGLVVDEGQRKKGIGKLLVEKAKQWSVANGLTNLKVRSNLNRIESNQFYPKCGLHQCKQQNVYQIHL
jgi:GNAT superfamily N-acetyltransferase